MRLSRKQRNSTLSNEEVARYSRHLILPEVGMEGQLKLKQAKVAADRRGWFGRARSDCIWRPPALAASASSTSMSSMLRICSGR